MYTLYVYNKNDDMFEEFKHFSIMQRAKDFVDNAREKIGSCTIISTEVKAVSVFQFIC